MTNNENINYIKIGNEIYNLTNENNILNFGNYFDDLTNKDNFIFYNGLASVSCDYKISKNIRYNHKFQKTIICLRIKNDIELLKEVKIGFDNGEELELSDLMNILRISEGNSEELFYNLNYNNYELAIIENIPKMESEFYKFGMCAHPIIDYINLVECITVTKNNRIWIDIESTYDSLSNRCREESLSLLTIDEWGRGNLCGTLLNGHKVRNNPDITVSSKEVNLVEEDKCIINLDNLMKACNTSMLLIEQKYDKSIENMIEDNEFVKSTMDKVYIGNEKLNNIVNELFTDTEFEISQMILNCKHYEIYVMIGNEGIKILVERKINDEYR